MITLVLICKFFTASRTFCSNFLQFEFLNFGTEKEHLKQLSEQDRESNIEKVKEMISQGISQRKISTELGISLGAVNKYSKL